MLVSNPPAPQTEAGGQIDMMSASLSRVYAPGTGSDWLQTGTMTDAQGEMVAFTMALQPNAHLNVQTYTLPKSDPRVGAAAQQLESAIELLVPGPQPDGDPTQMEHAMILGQQADGQPLFLAAAFPSADMPQPVADARAAAEQLRSLLVTHGTLSETNPQ